MLHYVHSSWFSGGEDDVVEVSDGHVCRVYIGELVGLEQIVVVLMVSLLSSLCLVADGVLLWCCGM